MIHEPKVRAAIPRRLTHLIVPLNQPARVRDGAGLFRRDRRGDEEHLGADILRPGLAELDAHALLPKIGRFGHRHVAHDQPLQPRHTQLDHLGVHRADHRVLAEDELSLHHAMRHRERHRQLRDVASQFRDVVVGPAVLFRGVLAVPGLEQAGDVFREVVPVAGRRRLGLEILGEAAVLQQRIRLRQVGRQHVVQRRDIRAALDRDMAAQRHDAAAGPPDIAEQALDDGGRPDDLHADGVMRPPDRVAERPGPLPPRILAPPRRRWRGTRRPGSR